MSDAEGNGPNHRQEAATPRKLGSSYDAAVKMFHREHDRWTQWALFFFGSIASIFVLSQYLTNMIPQWVFCGLAAFTSFSWILAGLNIRASTYAWRQVVMALEAGNNFRVFTKHRKICDNFDRWNDLAQTLRLSAAGPNSTRKQG
jgi:hypothetical protein